MAKKLALFISILFIIGIVLYFNQLSKEQSIKACILQVLTHNNIKGLSVNADSNQIIINGQSNASTKTKIQGLSFLQCGDKEVFTELSINDDSNKHTAWLQFEIDEVNNIISVTGKLKKQSQIKEVLAIFSDKFPNKTLAHSIDIDVLINQNSPLLTHLSYLLTAIEPIKVARIKLTDNTVKLEGLIRDSIYENQVLNKLKLLFSNEINIDNRLEQVIKDKNNIKPLEFSLPTLPPVEKQ